MKKLPYILLLLTGCCLLFSGKALAQFHPIKELFVDTSKLGNYQDRKALKRDYLSIHDVNRMYYYDFDTTNLLYLSGPASYGGPIGGVHYFENNKFLRYEIKDNQTLNSLLPGCRFFYEFADLNMERVIAKYNGKYFRYEDFNYLVREMGKGDMPQIAKIKALAQWRLWMFDDNVHVMGMDTVKLEVPGEKYPVKNSDDSIVYKGDYLARYVGDIEIDGNNYDYLVEFRYDKRTIHHISIFYPPGSKNNKKFGVSLGCRNIYSYKDNNNNIELFQNGIQISPENQNYKDVYYYKKTSGEITIKYLNLSVLGNQTKFRIYKSIGSEQTDIPDNYEFESPLIDVTSQGAEFQLSETDLPSGMYLIKYLNASGNWKFISDVVLIPEDIDDTQNIFGYTLEIHYLEQSFDNTTAMNGYISHRKNASKTLKNN